MSYLTLSFAVEFVPLCKFSKEQMKYIENPWHHAILTKYNLIPTKENAYNDIQVSISDTMFIARTYGIRPPKDEDRLIRFSDDDLYTVSHM